MKYYIVVWDGSLWMYPDNLSRAPIQTSVGADSKAEAYELARVQVSLEPGVTYMVRVYEEIDQFVKLG